MLNRVTLTESFIKQTLERYDPVSRIKLPLGRTARVGPSDITFDLNRITIHVEHDIPLLPAFDVDVRDFKVDGTKVMFSLHNIGIVGETPIDAATHLAAGLIQDALKDQPVTINGNDITIDIAKWLPFPGLVLTGIEIGDGITVTFDYHGGAPEEHF